MKSVIFTLCSNNYLSHAKTLGDSVLATNPKMDFIIGLVDKRDPQIDYDFFKPFEIIDFDKIGYPFFEEMLAVYNVVEFNTAVKPYYFEFLFNRYGAGSKIFYLDPDIVVYNELIDISNLLDDNNIVLTPNLTEASDEISPGELASLKHGMYNLGFIGIKHCDESLRFIKWWETRLRTHCLMNKSRGLFVDQKWIDLAPLFFRGIHVLYEVGYNMAWWNLNERKLITDGGKYFVNSLNQRLIFFHYSGYVVDSVNYSGRVNNSDRFSFRHHPELVEIFNEYAKSLKDNNYLIYSKLKPLLNFVSSKPKLRTRIRINIESKLKSFLRKF